LAVDGAVALPGSRVAIATLRSIQQPSGPKSIRAIGVADGKPILATHNLDVRDWSHGETDLSRDLSAGVLERMRTVFPDAFGANEEPPDIQHRNHSAPRSFPVKK
jgi:hypothetical protein